MQHWLLTALTWQGRDCVPRYVSEYVNRGIYEYYESQYIVVCYKLRDLWSIDIVAGVFLLLNLPQRQWRYLMSPGGRVPVEAASSWRPLVSFHLLLYQLLVTVSTAAGIRSGAGPVDCEYSSYSIILNPTLNFEGIDSASKAACVITEERQKPFFLTLV